MRFEGVGGFKPLIDEWSDAFDASENLKVIQPVSISGVAFMSIRDGGWIFEMGQ